MPDRNIGFHAASQMSGGKTSFHAGRVNGGNAPTGPQPSGRPTDPPNTCGRGNSNSTRGRGNNNNNNNTQGRRNNGHNQQPQVPQRTHLTVDPNEAQGSHRGGNAGNAGPAKARAPWAALKDFVPHGLGFTPKQTKEGHNKSQKKKKNTNTMPVPTVTHDRAFAYRDAKTERNPRVGPRPVQIEEVLDEQAPSSIVRAAEKAAAAARKAKK